MSGLVNKIHQYLGSRSGVVPQAFLGKMAGDFISINIAETTSEYEPADTSWYTAVTCSHAVQDISHRVICIGSLAWFAIAGRGQVQIQRSAGSSVIASASGVYSLWSSHGGQNAGSATQIGVFDPGTTDSVDYYLRGAEEGGDFRWGVNAAARSWLAVIETTGE